MADHDSQTPGDRGWRAEPIGEGVYRVESNDRSEIVYMAGTPEDAWAFWRGQVFRGSLAGRRTDDRADEGRAHRDVAHSLTAPMPATVRSILVEPGAAVRQGDTLMILEAMKMELPIRAPADAVVRRVNCREGDLVQPEAVLIEFTA